MNKHRISKISREVLEGVARDTGYAVVEIKNMLHGRIAMTFDVTASLVDRDSSWTHQDFNR